MPQNSPSFEKQKNNEIPNRLMELQVKTKANKGKKKIDLKIRNTEEYFHFFYFFYSHKTVQVHK